MSALLSLIQHQPDVHYGQIAKFLSLKDLARCQKTCRVFRDRMIVPVTERDVADGEIDYRLTKFAALTTAKKVGRTLATAYLTLKDLPHFDPSLMPRGVAIQCLTIFARSEFDRIFPPLIRATTQVRAIELNALTPPIVDAVVESCPLLNEIDIAYFEIPAMLSLVTRCPQLTNVSLRPSRQESDLTPIFAQLLNLQRFNYEQNGTNGDLEALTPRLRSFRTIAEYTEARQLHFLATHPLLEEYGSGNITPAVLRALSPRIQTLHIESSPTLLDEDFRAFVHHSLTALLICDNTFTYTTLAYMGQNLPQLRKLELNHRGMFVTDALRGAVVLHFPSLTNLRYQNDFGHTVRATAPPGQTLAQMWRQS
jgi:hypothetical protein